MTIGERLKLTDIDTYNKLINLCSKDIHKSNPIKLGDSIENLMYHDSYRRVRGKLKQR